MTMLNNAIKRLGVILDIDDESASCLAITIFDLIMDSDMDEVSELRDKMDAEREQKCETQS